MVGYLASKPSILYGSISTILWHMGWWWWQWWWTWRWWLQWQWRVTKNFPSNFLKSPISQQCVSQIYKGGGEGFFACVFSCCILGACCRVNLQDWCSWCSCCIDFVSGSLRAYRSPPLVASMVPPTPPPPPPIHPPPTLPPPHPSPSWPPIHQTQDWVHPFSGQPDSMFKDHSLRREDDLAATIDDLLRMGMKMAKTNWPLLATWDKSSS